MSSARRLSKVILARGCWASAAVAAMAVGTASFALSAGAASPSNVLAGYQVVPTGGLASASATFTVPAVTCTNADRNKGAAMMEGLYTENSVTSDYTYAQITIECTFGSNQAKYSFTFGTPAGTFVEPANPGDSVVTSISQSASATGVEIQDLTTGANWVANDAADVGSTYVNVGIMEFGERIPTFTKTAISNATVDGEAIGVGKPGQFDLESSKGNVTIICGSLRSNGTKFSLHFKSAI